MNKKKKMKRTWGIGIVCVVLLAVLVAGLFFMRMRNGVKIEAHNEFAIVNDFEQYRQDDEVWAEDRLGDSEYTMASSGCLVTCIASAMSSYGMELDPGEMNHLFSDNNVYDEAGNLLWENLNKLDSFGVDVFPQVEENSYIYIDMCLQGGWCPIARVRVHGIGSFHYVWILGAKEGEYICMDPLKDELTSLSDYGDRIYALRAVWFEEAQAGEDIEKESFVDESSAEENTSIVSESDTPQKENDIDVTNNEMVHEGIYVYVSQNEIGEDNLWYPDEASFLQEFGFDNAEPFYEYYMPEGEKRLSLYYDEETKEGCGIRYYDRDPTTFATGGMYGFTFGEIGEWNGKIADYMKPATLDGETGADYVSGYQENCGYDEQGRLISYESTGQMEENDEKETVYLMQVDYEYHENGALKHRSYRHNPMIFGTWYSVWESYFDEDGRVEYEDKYITHGSMDYYYIYIDDDMEPEYVLELDNNMGMWIPNFMEAKGTQ